MNIQQVIGSRIADSNVAAAVTVSVIAWRKSDGVSFEWYYSPSAADKIFNVAQGFCHERTEKREVAIRCEVMVSSFESATEEILEVIDSIFDGAVAAAESITLQ